MCRSRPDTSPERHAAVNFEGSLPMHAPKDKHHEYAVGKGCRFKERLVLVVRSTRFRIRLERHFVETRRQ